jgi:hypothetical protein
MPQKARRVHKVITGRPNFRLTHERRAFLDPSAIGSAEFAAHLILDIIAFSMANT